MGRYRCSKRRSSVFCPDPDQSQHHAKHWCAEQGSGEQFKARHSLRLNVRAQIDQRVLQPVDGNARQGRFRGSLVESILPAPNRLHPPPDTMCGGILLASLSISARSSAFCASRFAFAASARACFFAARSSSVIGVRAMLVTFEVSKKMGRDSAHKLQLLVSRRTEG